MVEAAGIEPASPPVFIEESGEIEGTEGEQLEGVDDPHLLALEDSIASGGRVASPFCEIEGLA
jgi:hypothetical protein